MAICARKVCVTFCHYMHFNQKKSDYSYFISNAIVIFFEKKSLFLFPFCVLFVYSWTELFSRYKGVFLLDALIKSVATVFASEEKATEISSFFFEKVKIQFGASIVQQALEVVRIRSRVRSHDVAQIETLLG